MIKMLEIFQKVVKSDQVKANIFETLRPIHMVLLNVQNSFQIY